MTIALPAIAKIKELRLRIATSSDEARRPLNRKAPFAAPLREIWVADIAFAATSPADARAFAAFFERGDGRVNSFLVPLAAGKFSRSASYTASLAAVPSTGSDTVRLNLSPASGTLKRGTLFAVGTPHAGSYQVFEVLQDVAASSDTAVKVAPRVRSKFAASDLVSVGTVNLKLKLANDSLDAVVGIVSGSVAISAREAL